MSAWPEEQPTPPASVVPFDVTFGGAYQVEDRATVEDFLDRHPMVVEQLSRGIEPIRQAFGGRVAPRLEVDLGLLYVVLETPLDVSEAVAAHQAVQESWSLEARRRCGSLLVSGIA